MSQPGGLRLGNDGVTYTAFQMSVAEEKSGVVTPSEASSLLSDVEHIKKAVTGN